jgi:hypothetical protein
MINSKKQSYQLMEAGAYGNTIGKWDLKDNFTNYRNLPDGVGVTIRTNRAGGGYVKYVRYTTKENTLLEIETYLLEAMLEGYKPEEIYMTELMPAECATIQGEYHELYGLVYNDTDRKHMREIALNKSQRTRELLRHHMCTEAYEYFMKLVEEYPMHVIEFSVYGVPVGALRWNTMIWEVRNY